MKFHYIVGNLDIYGSFRLSGIFFDINCKFETDHEIDGETTFYTKVFLIRLTKGRKIRLLVGRYCIDNIVRRFFRRATEILKVNK